MTLEVFDHEFAQLLGWATVPATFLHGRLRPGVSVAFLADERMRVTPWLPGEVPRLAQVHYFTVDLFANAGAQPRLVYRADRLFPRLRGFTVYK